MNLKPISIALLLFTAFSVHATDWSLNLTAMYNVLSKMRSSAQFPARTIDHVEVDRSPDKVDPYYEKIFADMQERVFGTQNTVKLETCLSCMIMTSYEAKTTYVQPYFIKLILLKYSQADARLILQFITAHEFSHLVQETTIGLGGFGKSVNGFVSLYDPQELIQRRAPIADYLSADLLAHAEVDAYALLILHEFVNEKPVVILRALQDRLELGREKLNKTHDQVEKYSNDDLEFRIVRDEILINKLWPAKP